MRLRLVATTAAAAALTLGTAVSPVAHAASGPPPLPTSTNGHAVQLVASGLKTPTSFAFGSNTVFVGDGGNAEGSAPPNGGLYVVKKDGTVAKVPSPLKFVAGLAWHNGALYGSGGILGAHGPIWVLVKWTGWNGTAFASRSRLYTAPAKFGGFNGIAFGANGRLYVGADVGLTDGNDHGPATTSPHVYQLLSFTAAGKDLRIVARGMRQPWQLAFGAGSNSPFVTDLGQDKGAKNPPDYLLHVHAGQNYGFPKCNGTVASACAGYAKPFQTFAPHLDLMGIGVRGSKLYVTSFLGRDGKAGEVFWLPRHGGRLTPLIKGFVAPVVGLGIWGSYLYVGELTGQVFRLPLATKLP